MKNKAEVRYYRTFEMLIQSEFALPELEAAEPGVPDLVIRRGIVDRPPPPPDRIRVAEFGEREHYLGFQRIGKYLITDGRVVDVDLGDGFSEDLVGFTLLGPVLAVILHLRGHFTLHGSAAEVPGGGVIFVGDKGAGKSTTMGAMVSSGFAVITDDIVAITDTQTSPKILPAYPMLKLTDPAIAAFGSEHFELIPTDVDGFDKRRARMTRPCPTKATPIKAIYVLEKADQPHQVQLDPHAAYLALLRFSYATRFGQRLIQGEAAAVHMRHCAAVARLAPVYRLAPPRDLSLLSDFIARIVAA